MTFASGQKQNGLDPNFLPLILDLMTSSERADISVSEFLTAFYGSLTRESSLVLVSLPLMFLILALISSLVSLPTLATILATTFIQRRATDNNKDNIQAIDDKLLENLDSLEYDHPRYS